MWLWVMAHGTKETDWLTYPGVGRSLDGGPGL